MNKDILELGLKKYQEFKGLTDKEISFLLFNNCNCLKGRLISLLQKEDLKDLDKVCTFLVDFFEKKLKFLPLFNELEELNFDLLNKQFTLGEFFPVSDSDNYEEIICRVSFLELLEEFQEISETEGSEDNEYGLDYNRFYLEVYGPNSRGNYFILQENLPGSTMKLSFKKSIELYKIDKFLEFKKSKKLKKDFVEADIMRFEELLKSSLLNVKLSKKNLKKLNKKLLKFNNCD